MASPTNPDLYQPVRHWPSANQGFYTRFRRWLREAGYSKSALSIYGCAVRLALSQLDKPYWQIDDDDLSAVRTLIAQRFESAATRQGYCKGLTKLAEYLRRTNGQPTPPKPVNWSRYLAGLPDCLPSRLERTSTTGGGVGCRRSRPGWRGRRSAV